MKAHWKCRLMPPLRHTKRSSEMKWCRDLHLSQPRVITVQISMWTPFCSSAGCELVTMAAWQDQEIGRVTLVRPGSSETNCFLENTSACSAVCVWCWRPSALLLLKHDADCRSQRSSGTHLLWLKLTVSFLFAPVFKAEDAWRLLSFYVSSISKQANKYLFWKSSTPA